MLATSDPVTAWALTLLVSVVIGTFLLIAVAFTRRWNQIRFGRNLHSLHQQFRPALATILAGTPSPDAIESLRQLSSAELELLLDPVFARRKLTRPQWALLRELCADLGLIALWQTRTAAGRARVSPPAGHATLAAPVRAERAVMRHLLRARSIRNLGKLGHRPSWPLLVEALDDRRADIQGVALRALAAIGAPESFAALCERLRAAVQGVFPAPPLSGLRTAMVDFDLACAPALLPLLLDADRRVRLQAIEILRTMVCREADRLPGLTLTPELLSADLVELLLTGMAADTSAEIRGYTAEVIVFLDDARAQSVIGNLLGDRHGAVRVRAVRALSRVRQAARNLARDLRASLHDSHHRVRETAIQAFISLGQEGKLALYQHFLGSKDLTLRRQIVEGIEHNGLMTVLVKEYSTGKNSLEAQIVEELAGDALPLGLSSVLRTLSPENRQRFLDRFLPVAESKMRFLHEALSPWGRSKGLQPGSAFPPSMAA
jgi:HEAT repeat protein